MKTCPVCGTEQTPTTYCVVDGDFHTTFGTEFLGGHDA